MVSFQEQERAKRMLEGQDEQHVLNFIALNKVVTLDILVEQFPRIRWGTLFSTLGRFRREGLMTVHQVESKLEIRINKLALRVF